MNKIYVRYIKRVLDFTLSLAALIILSPLLLALMLIGAVEMKGNPFFVQRRQCRNGRTFNIIKFRSMTNEKRNGELLPDEDRLTKYGVFLRSTSLDELPQLINILIGDMSIVGPRPKPERELLLYKEQAKRRHEVRPGLTGWAQVNGRNNITAEQMFKYDVWYVDHAGFWLDFKIILMTVRCVLKREGVFADHREAAKKFKHEQE